MSLVVLGVAALVFAVAAAAQAAAGFGFALLAVPLLSTIAGPRAAVVGSAAVGLLLTAFMAARDRGHVERRSVWTVVLASLLGMPIGLLVLTRASETGLRVLIAVVVLAFTALLARGLTLPHRPGTDVGAGFASGVLATATGTNGPPLVIAFHAKDLAPAAFRATLAATFLIQGALAMGGFAATGRITHEALLLGLAGVPGVAAGWTAGQRLFERLDHDRFRRVVLAMLAASGVVTLVAAFTS